MIVVRFEETLLGAKFLNSCRGRGSFSNPGDSNRVPPRCALTPVVAWYYQGKYLANTRNSFGVDWGAIRIRKAKPVTKYVAPGLNPA